MLLSGTRRFTFAIIGDTHVKPESGDQSAPWKVNELATARARWIAREIERYAPDFIVHLGDLVHPVPELSTFDEAVGLTKTIFGATHNRLHVIPGNHDVGDKPNKMMPAKMVRDDWVALHEKSFGPSFHAFDRDDCRFVFINNPIFNAGSPAEARQRVWLEETLALSDGRRLFLFMHYPLFVLDPTEVGNYDNVDEPARSDVLGLIRSHRAEAVFAGHVHNIFYHRLDGTEFYVMPATSFVRQDYSEFFRTDAIHENGRNDAEKLGFALVEVHDSGHVVHYIRSYGEELASGATSPVASREALALPHPKKAGGAPLGVFMRHPWAEVVALPYNGPMDEFLRKEARNDYPLAALWRLGIRHMRVPLSDLLDARIARRMADLVATGHVFTVFGFGVPDGVALDRLLARADLVARYECVLPLEAVADEAPRIVAFRKALARPVLFSPLASSAGEKKIGSRIELFVSHGFRLDQLPQVESLLAGIAPGAIDHIVVRVGLAGDIVGTAAMLAEWQARHGCRVDLHLRIAADNPATNVTDDGAILKGVVIFYAAALAHPEISMFVDPFMDIDRGYFVRHGLVDRRMNLRPAGLAVEALAAHLGEGERAGIKAISTPDGLAIKILRRSDAAVILLPEPGAALTIDARATHDIDTQTIRVVPLRRPWLLDPAIGDGSNGQNLPAQVSEATLLVGRRMTASSADLPVT